MGITSFSLSILDKYVKEGKSVCELGAQNLYDKHYDKHPYADVYYKSKGMTYECIDLSKENGAIEMDLESPQKIQTQFDLVTDFGTSEHIKDSYNVHKIIHDLTKVGGIIIKENPKTGNWIGHGFNYVSVDFYNKLAELNGYEILEIDEHPAMNNTIDGWNVYVVFKKVKDSKFISRTKFNTCGIKPS